jgi:hypothetical protein
MAISISLSVGDLSPGMSRTIELGLSPDPDHGADGFLT